MERIPLALDLELEPEGGLSENQREQLIDLLDPGPRGMWISFASWMMEGLN
jgi:hypothetical protein